MKKNKTVRKSIGVGNLSKIVIQYRVLFKATTQGAKADR